MATKTITIGSAVNIFAYDDTAFPTAAIFQGPIELTSAISGNHAVKKSDADIDYASASSIANHIADTSNPHNVTATQIAGAAPVANGTYTIGARLTPLGVDGTITTSNGIITAIQQAT